MLIADPGREYEAALRLGRIGFDHVAGYLQNGLNNLVERPELIAFSERFSPQFAAELLLAKEPPLVYCAGGYRSSIVASLLLRRGFEPVAEIAGGIAAWEAAKLPLRGATSLGK